MSYNDDFSRELLRLERQSAKAFVVDIPKGLTALCHGREWFVQGRDGDPGMYVKADNGYHARAMYIRAKIAAKYPQLEEGD